MGRAVPRLLKRLFKATILVLAVAVLALISQVVYGYMKETPLLTLREVTIEGCQKTSEKEILSMTQLDRQPNILSINLAKLRSKVEANPWIDRAEIRRIFPDRISIRIIERQPVAIILLDRLYYIDGQRVIFARLPKGHQIDHPVLTGLHKDDFKTRPDDAWGLVSKALRLVRLIEGGEALSQRDISEIHMDKALGISLYTNEGAIEIKLGLDHYEAKWKRLERVWRHLRRGPLKPTYIDCNYEKRVIVKMRDTTAFYAKRLIKKGGERYGRKGE
jgi:cell division protein FtsQ